MSSLAQKGLRLVKKTVRGIANTGSAIVRMPYEVVAFAIDTLPGADVAADYIRTVGKYTRKAINPLEWSSVALDAVRKYVRTKAKRSATTELQKIKGSFGPSIPSTITDARRLTIDVLRNYANANANAVANGILVALTPARDAIGSMGAKIGDATMIPGMASLGLYVAKYTWDSAIRGVVQSLAGDVVKNLFEQAIGYAPDEILDNLDIEVSDNYLVSNIITGVRMENYLRNLQAKTNELINRGVSVLTNEDKYAIGYVIENRYADDYAIWLRVKGMNPGMESQALYWVDLNNAIRSGYPNFAKHYAALMDRSGRNQLQARQERADATKALWMSLGYPSHSTYVAMMDFVRKHGKAPMPYSEYVALRNRVGTAEGLASSKAGSEANRAGSALVQKKNTKKFFPIAALALGAMYFLS